MRRFIPAKFWLTLVVATAVVHARPSGAEAEVRAVLDAQVAAWNRGDLDGFMQGY